MPRKKVDQADLLVDTANMHLCTQSKEFVTQRVEFQLVMQHRDIHQVAKDCRVDIDFVKQVNKKLKAKRDFTLTEDPVYWAFMNLRENVERILERIKQIGREFAPGFVTYISPCHRIAVYYAIENGDGTEEHIDYYMLNQLWGQAVDGIRVRGPFCSECKKKIDHPIQIYNYKLANAVLGSQIKGQRELEKYFLYMKELTTNDGAIEVGESQISGTPLGRRIKKVLSKDIAIREDGKIVLTRVGTTFKEYFFDVIGDIEDPVRRKEMMEEGKKMWKEGNVLLIAQQMEEAGYLEPEFAKIIKDRKRLFDASHR